MPHHSTPPYPSRIPDPPPEEEIPPAERDEPAEHDDDPGREPSDDDVDEAGRESFPASDPPAN